MKWQVLRASLGWLTFQTEALRQSSCCTTCCQNLVALLLRMGLSRWVSGGVQEQSVRVRRFWPLWQEGKGLLLPCQLVSLSYLAVSEQLLVIRAAGSHFVCYDSINTMNIQCEAVTSERGWWKQLQVVLEDRKGKVQHPTAGLFCLQQQR